MSDAPIAQSRRLGRTASQLARFLANLPTTFERLELRMLGGAGGPDTLRELEARDISHKSHEEVAASLFDASEQQAEVLGREARAEVVAYRADKRISSHIFKAGLPADDDRLDGTPESIIAQGQRHSEALMRMSIMERSALTGAYTAMLQLQTERIKELEAENTKLRRATKDDDLVPLAIAELEADERKSERLEALLQLVLGQKNEPAADLLTKLTTKPSDATTEKKE